MINVINNQIVQYVKMLSTTCEQTGWKLGRGCWGHLCKGLAAMRELGSAFLGDGHAWERERPVRRPPGRRVPAEFWSRETHVAGEG